MGIILMVCGCLWIMFGLTCPTGNYIDAFICNVFPFFSGLAAVVCAMDIFGWVQIFS